MTTQSGVVVGRSVTVSESATFGNGVVISTSVTIPVDPVPAPPPPPGPPTPPPGTLFYAPLWLSTEYADTVGGAAATTSGTVAIADSIQFPDGAFVSDGSVGNYVSYAVESGAGEFNFTGDFLVQFYAAKTADTPDLYDCALAFGDTSGVGGFAVELSSARGLAIVYSGAAIIEYAFDPNDGIVHKYQWQRVSGDMQLLIDDILVANLTYASNINNSGVLILGDYANGQQGLRGAFNGQIQLASISKT